MDKRQFMRNLFYNFLLALFFCSLASFLVFARFNYPLTGIDDANIFFVYARNLVSGHGLVYNAGGERVEGFTSFLWTMICALAFAETAHPEFSLLLVNIVLLSLGLAVALTYLQNEVLRSEENRHVKFIYSAVFLTLLFTSPRYIAWNTITLMENSLWSTLLLVTAIFTIKDYPSSRSLNFGFIPLLILLMLTRPESMLWGVVFLAIYFVRLALARDSAYALRTLAPSVIGVLITLIVLTLFRLRYFGYPLPNTYYAKVSPSFIYNLQQGSIYLSKYLISDPVVLLSVIAISISSLYAIARIFRKQVPEDGALFLSVVAWTGLLIPLITGGDHFGSFRVYQSIYPIEVLCLFVFVNRILPDFLKSRKQPGISQPRHVPTGLISALALILFFSSQLQVWNSVGSELDVEFRAADYGRKNGAFIQGLFSSLPALPSLGVVTSGGIKYSYDGEIVDLMGLNNVTMAHNQGDRRGIKDHAAFDIPTFYVLQPDIVWPTTLDVTRWQYSELEIKQSWENTEGFKGLFDEPHFLELYTYAEVSNKPESRYALIAWFKNDLLKQLGANPAFHVIEYQYTP